MPSSAWTVRYVRRATPRSAPHRPGLRSATWNALRRLATTICGTRAANDSSVAGAGRAVARRRCRRQLALVDDDVLQQELLDLAEVRRIAVDARVRAVVFLRRDVGVERHRR